jgi:hypothetical protein
MTGQERDGVLELLHDAMEERTATPPPAPVWPQIERGLRRARRRRRARTAGKAGAGLLAVSALVAGVQTNLMPYPGWATVPVAGGASVLADGGTRGSLAGDAAWLDGLRRAIADRAVAHEPGGERWAPPAASDVDVLYAGDVGSHRLALVEGDWRWGVVSSRQQVWYTGRVGDAPGDLAEARNDSPAEIAAHVAHGGVYPAGTEPIEGEAAVVVLSPRQADVRLRGPVEYAADGTARRRTATVPRTGEGLYEQAVTGPGSYTLLVPGRGYDETFTATRVPDAVDVPVGSALPPVHGDAVPPTGELQAEVSAALSAADLPVATTPRRLLWSGTVDGDRYRVVALTAPSGARVLVVLRHDFSGADLATWATSGAALPAGTPQDAAMAWPVAAGTDDRPVPSGRVAALGPVGATTAVFVGDGEEVGRTALTGGFAVAPAPGADTVRFLDARDRALTEVPVAPLLGWSDSLADVLAR